VILQGAKESEDYLSNSRTERQDEDKGRIKGSDLFKTIELELDTECQAVSFDVAHSFRACPLSIMVNNIADQNHGKVEYHDRTNR